MSTKITESKPLERKVILLVEDDRLIANAYSKWLEAVGAKTMVANDGVQCLRILDEQKIDLVLLDLGMPGLNGYDTLMQLRQRPHLKDLPVIILSNTTMTENREGFEDIKKAGVKDILRKYETSLSELVRCISSYFPKDASFIKN